MSAVSTRTGSFPVAGIYRSVAGVRLATVWFAASLTGIAALLAFDLLRGLGLQDIADWDEARHAVNAYEMLQRGDVLVQTWRGAVDYWNLKPPLSMWADMLSMQVFGYTPFALRLPAVLATVLTVATVTLFAHRWAGRAAAVTAALVLTTCDPFITTHNARTGDPDALFLLGLTVGLLAVLEAPRHPRLLLLAAGGFSFAFLAKSFHAALLIPFAVGYLLWCRTASAVRRRHVAIAALGFVPVLLWALARFLVDGTRFLSAMFLVDVLHRTERPAEGNSGGPLYYGKLLLHFFGPWLGVLALAVVLWLVLRRRGSRLPDHTRRVAVGLAAWSVLILVLFSGMATKLPWYTLPAYPALAVLIGLMVAVTARGAGVQRTVVLVAAVLIAAEVGQGLILSRVLHERPDPVQVALQSLHRDPALLGRTVRLDTPIGAWRPGRVASAELTAGLIPEAGGAAAARTDPRSLLVVRRGAGTAKAFPGIASRALSSRGAYLVVPASALAAGEHARRSS